MANNLDRNDPLWGNLRNSVKRWAERLLGPSLSRREDASDLAQTAMVSLFAKAEELANLEPAERETRARQILRRRLVDLIRRHRCQCRDVQREVSPRNLASTGSEIDALFGEQGTNPAEKVAEQEHQARLIVALASLPETEQEVIRRRYFERQDWKAIGEAMLVPRSTLIRCCVRAIESMRAFYHEDLEP